MSKYDRIQLIFKVSSKIKTKYENISKSTLIIVDSGSIEVRKLNVENFTSSAKHQHQLPGSSLIGPQYKVGCLQSRDLDHCFAALVSAVSRCPGASWSLAPLIIKCSSYHKPQHPHSLLARTGNLPSTAIK